MQINPYLFIYIEENKIVCWNYITHEQFILEPAYIERLINWSKSKPEKLTEIDLELLEAGLLQENGDDQRNKWGWDILSYIFHKGTQDIPLNDKPSLNEEEWVDNYLEFSDSIIDEMPDLFTERHGADVKLPEPDISLFCNTSFLDVLQKRKTSRSFYFSNIPLKTFSTLLFASFGQFHGEWSELTNNNLEITGLRKTSASGGGLHCEEAYVLAFSIEDLEQGIYHYNVKNHKLTQIKVGNYSQQLLDILYQQYFCQNLSFGIFITARFDKSWWKYRHSRAYRNVLMDIGHVSQTFQLCATALNYQTWISGAFSDSAINTLLDLDTAKENTLFFVGAGKSDWSSLDSNLVSRLELKNVR